MINNNFDNGISNFRKQVSDFKSLISNLILVINGCKNTKEIENNLVELYIKIITLERTLEKFN